MSSFTVADSAFKGTRTVWVANPSAEPAKVCCVFLDAELYIDRLRCEDFIDKSITRVYVSSGKPNDRHIDYTCND
jgi:hypothetical protein